MGNIHYYELSFYHDEDDDMADEKKRAGFAIKTEIDPVIDDYVAYQILFGTNGNIKYPFASLTQVMEISEDDANYFFDVKDLSVRVENELGIYYKRDPMIPEYMLQHIWKNM